MTGREQFNRFKPIIIFLVYVFNFFGKKINYKLLILIRNLNGKLGILLRFVLVKNISKNVGDNVSIHPGVFLFNVDKIDFGNNVSIHPMCYIEGVGGIKIGNDVSIAHSTSLLSTNHSWSDPLLPIKYNEQKNETIVINNDVWIGCGVRILPGVTINERCVIAAGAVVNNNIEANSLVGGVPAKFLKSI